MGGGLMQLVAYGAQDVYLTGNPQITFWNQLNKHLTDKPISVAESSALSPEMVILHTAPIFRSLSQRLAKKDAVE